MENVPAVVLHMALLASNLKYSKQIVQSCFKLLVCECLL